MNRTDIIKQLLIAIRGERYLEIGLGNCNNFFTIPCHYKYGVDPSPLPSKALAAANLHQRIFQKTSDAFFREDAPGLFKEKIAVAFIDGLHEYEQAYRDALNCLVYLDEGGIVVLHDCNPVTREAQMATRQQVVWNGDVWKTIVRLRTHRDMRVFVLDTDEGVGIVMKGTPELTLAYTPDEIQRLSYEELEKNRHELLNLKEAAFFLAFLEQVRR